MQCTATLHGGGGQWNSCNARAHKQGGRGVLPRRRSQPKEQTSSNALPHCLGAVGSGGVVWCGVVWCGVVWCAEGAVARRQWPGCLPTGTGKREGRVCSARAVCKCVVMGGKRGSRGKPTCHLPGDGFHPRSSRYTPSLYPPIGAGVAPTPTPTPSCCQGPGGLSAKWHTSWRGRTLMDSSMT